MFLTVASDFGYVVLVVIASILMLQWMSWKVNMGRKKYEVKYPAMYSDKNQMFNCIQRAHQNTLENYPAFLILLVVGGLEYPCLNAGAGLLYLVSRVVYAHGYYTGEPANRRRGNFGYLGLLIMLGSSVSMAIYH